jgi:thioesterase domain-containing protein
LAKVYIEDIKKIQPTGPYSILGFCFGGAIAYEVAYRLIKEEQEDVPLLAILNFGNPLLTKPVRLEKEIDIKNVIINNLKKLYRIPAKEKIKFLIEKVNNTSELINTNIVTNHEGTQISPRAAISKAINRYVPKPYPGDILLIKADSVNNRDDHLGWETSNKGEVYVRCIPTEHELLLKEPNIKLVVQMINEHIK